MFAVPGGVPPKDYEFILTAATSSVYVGYILATGVGSIAPTTIEGNTISSLTDIPSSPRFFLILAAGTFSGGVPASMQFYVDDRPVNFLVTCTNPGTNTDWWNASNSLGLISGATHRIGINFNY